MPRTFNYKLEIVCAGNGTIDEAQVENMLDLAFQDLVYDDEFISALDEKESVTIRVSKLDKRMVDSKGS
jgi:hypothetical protein